MAGTSSRNREQKTNLGNLKVVPPTLIHYQDSQVRLLITLARRVASPMVQDLHKGTKATTYQIKQITEVNSIGMASKYL